MMIFTPALKRRLIEAIEALPTVTPCTHGGMAECDYFDAEQAGGYCKRWEQPVPSEAQAEGCKEWVELLPF